jgi:hypothetical protein
MVTTRMPKPQREGLRNLAGAEGAVVGTIYNSKYDLVSTALPEATRIALEKLMASGNYDFQSDFARKYLARGVEKGREEGP